MPKVRSQHRKVKPHPGGAPRRLDPQTAAVAPHHPEEAEASFIDFYQDRIVDLERTVTTLREQLFRAEQAAADGRERADYLSKLFEHAPAGYVVHDNRGYLSESNPAAASLLGLRDWQHGRATLGQFILKADLSKWLEHLRYCERIRRPHAVELLLHGRNGQVVPARLLTQPRRQPLAGEPDCYYTILLDITERRRTEATLRQTQQDYLRLINTIEGIVWEADAQTLEVRFVSSYAQRLLGYPLAEWQRPGFWLNRIHAADRDRVANEVLRTVVQGGELRTEYRVLTAERQVVWLHDSITVTGPAERLKLLGVALDVTEQRHTQEQLRAAQSLLAQRVEERTAELRRTVAELEGFSYSISHDLRAPLRAMMGFAELAVQVGGEQLPPPSKAFMERVITGAQRADRLVQDLLSYSRVSRANFKLEPVDLEKLVRELIAHTPQFQPPHAEVHWQGPLLPVLGHEVSLSQVLTNLLSNATKFVPRGTVPQVRLWTEPVDGQVRLWVRDNGIGIEPQHLGRIFGIFERVHSNEQFEGTGIGLAIVRKGVERMDGSVGVESVPGKGTSFWIQLKAVKPSTERTRA